MSHDRPELRGVLQAPMVIEVDGEDGTCEVIVMPGGTRVILALDDSLPHMITAQDITNAEAVALEVER
jgi:hypothetical protein